MSNKAGFIKLLLIAVICDLLIVIGYLMIAINIDYKDYNLAMDGIGFIILFNTFNYVFRHEPNRRIKAMHDNWFVYRFKL